MKSTNFEGSDTMARISLVAQQLAETPCTDVFGLVIYDLPGRDCAAKASNGELATGELSTYESSYIDPIVAAIKAHDRIDRRIAVGCDVRRGQRLAAGVIVACITCTGHAWKDHQTDIVQRRVQPV